MVRLYNNFGLCAFIFWAMHVILGYARLRRWETFFIEPLRAINRRGFWLEGRCLA